MENCPFRAHGLLTVCSRFFHDPKKSNHDFWGGAHGCSRFAHGLLTVYFVQKKHDIEAVTTTTAKKSLDVL